MQAGSFPTSVWKFMVNIQPSKHKRGGHGFFAKDVFAGLDGAEREFRISSRSFAASAPPREGSAS
jgi:hypothetical protein